MGKAAKTPAYALKIALGRPWISEASINLGKYVNRSFHSGGRNSNIRLNGFPQSCTHDGLLRWVGGCCFRPSR